MQNQTLKNSLGLNSILQLLLYFALMLIYTTYISKIFAYEGYNDDFNINRFIVGGLTVSALSILIASKNRPSTIFLHMAMALVISPSFVLFAGGGVGLNFYLISLGAIVTIILIVKINWFKRLEIMTIDNAKTMNFLVLAALGFIASIFAFGGAKYLNFDLSLVYSIREDAADNLPGVYSYLSSIFSKILVPTALVLSIVYKKWIYIALLSFCLILIFGLTAHKSPLLYSPLVIFIYWIADKSKMVAMMLIGLLLLVAISFFDFYLMQNSDSPLYGWFGSLFTRRALFVPAFLNSLYVEYFSNNAIYFWADSKFSLGLAQSPYKLKSVNLIGSIYFGNDEMSANTGWIGSGFANGRYLGVLLYSILIGFLFSFIDLYAKKIGMKLVVASFTLPAITFLSSSDLTTMLLSHGLIVSVILIMVLSPIRGPKLLNNEKNSSSDLRPPAF